MFLCAPLPDAPEVTVTGPEGRHAVRVRRLRVGERIDLTDGRGALARCRVSAVGADELTCAVERRESAPAPAVRLVVAQALPKGDRGELAVELMTEVGVDEIVPWAASRCVTRWVGERGERSRRKWVDAAAAAARQSRRTRWPLVAELADTAALAERARRATAAIVLREDATEPLTSLLAGDAGPTGGAGSARRAGPAGLAGDTGEVVLVVGPEGGIDDEEFARLAAAGARATVLGPTVLRTSTAGVVAAALVLAGTPEWNHGAGWNNSTAPDIRAGAAAPGRYTEGPS